jgi:hypothetical protein
VAGALAAPRQSHLDPGGELAGMTESIVYFVRNPENDHVRIGSDSKGLGGRARAHSQYGFDELLAALPGDDEDEKLIHEFFCNDLVPNRKSVYRGERIYDYVTWLVARAYAVPSLADVSKLPRLPWAVWAPAEYRADEIYEGQLSIIAALPPPERVAATHKLAYLSSESDEWNTPPLILDAAREVFGGTIDTDPASNFEAQKFVQASVWYSKAQNGLRTDLPWSGSVWMNPPYGIGDTSAGPFVRRLLSELRSGNVREAITNLNVSSTTTNWFSPIWNIAALHLIYQGRPDYWRAGDEGASGPNKGTIFSYFGDSEDRFVQIFGPMGHLLRVT